MISIIIPIRNEAASIEKCLNAVLAQDYPQDQMEIFVVDGMSSDDTRAIVEAFAREHPSIKLLSNPGRIVPTGMNIALRQCRGDLIIRVDGHCIIAPDYVSQCLKHLRSDGIDGVGGPMESIGETFIAEAIALAMSSPFGVGNSAFRTTSGETKLVDTIPFPAYTREIILKAGLYDEELVRNQDDEYNYRIRALGGKLLLSQDVRSRYYSRGSFQKLWQQYYQYGFWKVRVLQKHPRQMSLRQFVPPCFVLAMLVSAALGIFTPWGLAVFGLVLGFYGLANLTASLMISLKKGLRFMFLLMFAFGIIHISYGTGFLVGLLRFMNRWKDSTGSVPDGFLGSDLIE